MSTWIRAFVLVLTAAGMSACGSDGGGSSTSGPSGNVSSVAITMSSALKVGQTEQATAAATLTSGGTQSVTAGFRSDTPAVASVTDAGAVTAAGPGLANIFVVSGGKQGTKSLKVVPDFAGSWSGSYVVTSCTATGFFLDPGEMCTDGFNPGSQWPINVSLNQTMDSLSGTVMFGAISGNAAPSTIGADGSVSFTMTLVIPDNPIRVEATVRLSTAAPGTIVGTVTQNWTSVSFSGNGRFDGTISMQRAGLRTSTMSQRVPAGRPATLTDVFKLFH